MVVSHLRNFANRKVVVRDWWSLCHEDATIHVWLSRLPRKYNRRTTHPMDKVRTCGLLSRYFLCLNIGWLHRNLWQSSNWVVRRPFALRLGFDPVYKFCNRFHIFHLGIDWLGNSCNCLWRFHKYQNRNRNRQWHLLPRLSRSVGIVRIEDVFVSFFISQGAQQTRSQTSTFVKRTSTAFQTGRLRDFILKISQP